MKTELWNNSRGTVLGGINESLLISSIALYCLLHRDDDVLCNTVTSTFCSVKMGKKT